MELVWNEYQRKLSLNSYRSIKSLAKSEKNLCTRIDVPQSGELSSSSDTHKKYKKGLAPL